MRTVIIAITLLSLSTVNTFAAELYARVVQIEENYETVTEYSPIKVCRDEEIPIYGNINRNTDNSGNVLLGMILGGVSQSLNIFWMPKVGFNIHFQAVPVTIKDSAIGYK